MAQACWEKKLECLQRESNLRSFDQYFGCPTTALEETRGRLVCLVRSMVTNLLPRMCILLKGFVGRLSKVFWEEVGKVEGYDHAFLSCKTQAQLLSTS